MYMGLKKKQRVFSKIGQFGNFLQKPLSIGDIVLNDDGQHVLWKNITQIASGFTLDDKVLVGREADLKYTTETSVGVTIGGTVDAKVASGEIELKFNAKNSAFVYLKGITRTSLPLGYIDQIIKEYWRSQNWNTPSNRLRYNIITEVVEAESGSIIFSEEKGNRVVIQGKNDTALTSLVLAGEGKIEYVSNSKSTLEIISESPVQPMYVAMRIKANGQFEVVG